MAVVQGISGRVKRYVSVTARMDEDGHVRPLSIQWYDGMYTDVTNVMTALAEIEGAGLPYEFCRIGESWDDIEFRASCNNEELAVHVEPSVAIEIV